MKLLNKKIPYTLKRIVPMAMLAGATMFGAGCDNNEPDDPVNTQPQKINKELYFADDDGTHIAIDTILHYLSMDNVDTVYLVPRGTFYPPNNLGGAYVGLWRKNVLEPCTNLSPRVRGKGDMEFGPNIPAQVPQDSLWFVSKGWTVNKAYWDQEKLFGR